MEKKKIENILNAYDINELDRAHLATDIFALFDVSQQRELLNSFADAWNMPENTKDEYVFERDINTFLKDKTIL